MQLKLEGLMSYEVISVQFLLKPNIRLTIIKNKNIYRTFRCETEFINGKAPM